VIHPLLNRMHHYLGAENVPSAETYCGGAMGFKDGRRDAQQRRQAPARLPAGPAAGRDRQGRQLLRDLSELPADTPPGLHDDDHDLAAGLRTDEARRGMAFPSRRDEEEDSCLPMRSTSGIAQREDWAIPSSRISGSARAAIQPGRTQSGKTALGIR
jgi:hypothetical protein